MQTVTRNVSDISPHDLPALEHLIGARLQPSQKVIVQVVEKEPDKEGSRQGASEPQLPEWFNVYDGLSDAEIDELDAAIRERSDVSRNYE